MTLHKKVIDNVVFGSTIMTDEFKSYRKLDMIYKHDFIAIRNFNM